MPETGTSTKAQRRQLLERLANLRTRARLNLAFDGLGSLSLALVTACLLSFGVDRVFRLPRDQRALVLAFLLCVLAALVWRRLVSRLRVPIENAELARQVERVHPSFDWKLVSAVQFLEDADPRGSRELAEIVVDQAVAAAKDVDFGTALDMRELKRRWLSGGVALVCGFLLVRSFPTPAHTWFERNVLLSATASWPKDTQLHVDRFGDRSEIFVPRGSELSIAVTASGVVPSRVTVAFEYPHTQLKGSRALTKAGDRAFRGTLPPLGEDVLLTFYGGDDEVGPLRVNVVTPPWLEALEIESVPPEYTKVPSRKFGVEAGEMPLPAGSLVKVRATCSKKLKSARLDVRFAGAKADAPPESFAGTVVPSSDPRKGDALEASVTLDRTAAITILVRDQDDLGLGRDVSFTLRAIADAAPKVQLALHGIGTLCTPDALLPLELKLEDDYGLASAQLRYRATSAKEKPDEGALPVAIEGLPRQLVLPLEWDLNLLPKKLVPGTFFSFFCEASDADPHGAKTTASSSFALRVVTSEELLLDLIRRQHEQRRELEKLREDEDKLVPLLDNLDTVAQERAPRTQRAAIKIVGDASRALAQVTDEMKNNRLLDERARNRITEDVVAPLDALRAGELMHSRDLTDGVVAAKDEKTKLERSHEAAGSVRACVQELDRIIAQMRRVADLAELVAKVREILKRQRDLMDDTKKNAGD